MLLEQWFPSVSLRGKRVLFVLDKNVIAVILHVAKIEFRRYYFVVRVEKQPFRPNRRRFHHDVFPLVHVQLHLQNIDFRGKGNGEIRPQLATGTAPVIS